MFRIRVFSWIRTQIRLFFWVRVRIGQKSGSNPDLWKKRPITRVKVEKMLYFKSSTNNTVFFGQAPPKPFRSHKLINGRIRTFKSETLVNILLLLLLPCQLLSAHLFHVRIVVEPDPLFMAGAQKRAGSSSSSSSELLYWTGKERKELGIFFKIWTLM